MDVCVATYHTERVRTYTEEHGVEFISLGDIREMLLYDIDRDTENELAQEHLGEPLTAATSGEFRCTRRRP